MDLFGKIVVITGASRGIGAATAEAFVSQGSTVVLCARTECDLIEISRRVGKHATLVVPADITRIEDVNMLIDTTIEHYNRIDILINNAGVGLIGPIHQMEMSDFNSVLAVNLHGPLHCMQKAIPIMKSQSGGIIMNVSSMITRIATPGSGGYRAAKCALNAITDAARIELHKFNIRVIPVYPGLTATRFFSSCLGVTEKPVVLGDKRLRGRAPEFIAKRIVEGASKEPSAVYMTRMSLIMGSIALMFPHLAGKIVEAKKAFRR